MSERPRAKRHLRLMTNPGPVLDDADAPGPGPFGLAGGIRWHTALDLVGSALRDFENVSHPANPEYFASLLMGTVAAASDDPDTAIAKQIVPGLESAGTPAAATGLIALRRLGGRRVATAAKAAAGRLRAAGVAAPAEVEGLLAVKPTAFACRELRDRGGDLRMIAAAFDRAGHTDAVMVEVDPNRCGEATYIGLLEADDLPTALDYWRERRGAEALALIEKPVTPTEFRWLAEMSLRFREDHDRQDVECASAGTLRPVDPYADPEEPGYPGLAALVRARLRALPASRKHAPAHSLGRAPVTSLGQRQILRLRVDLRDTRPPIWRRLEVPADLTLYGLHEVLLIAFGWDGSHSHGFETGRSGRRDGRSAEYRGLDQIVGSPGDKLHYTYDFHDNWRHVIVVEKVLPREPDVAYPRCTDGRRAAPPQDCGGPAGYRQLVAALADPEHPEHAAELDWLGLDSAAEFDPAACDLADIDTQLGYLRWRQRR
jgi:hypothetical protein